VIAAVPSDEANASIDALSTVTRYTCSSARMISEETFISNETNPRAQMTGGTSSRSREKMRNRFVVLHRRNLSFPAYILCDIASTDQME
jgi:hypothetical protein